MAYIICSALATRASLQRTELAMNNNEDERTSVPAFPPEHPQKPFSAPLQPSYAFSLRRGLVVLHFACVCCSICSVTKRSAPRMMMARRVLRCVNGRLHHLHVVTAAPRLRAEAVTTGAADRFWKRSHRPPLVTTYYVYAVCKLRTVHSVLRTTARQ